MRMRNTRVRSRHPEVLTNRLTRSRHFGSDVRLEASSLRAKWNLCFKAVFEEASQSSWMKENQMLGERNSISNLNGADRLNTSLNLWAKFLCGNAWRDGLLIHYPQLRVCGPGAHKTLTGELKMLETDSRPNSSHVISEVCHHQFVRGFRERFHRSEWQVPNLKDCVVNAEYSRIQWTQWTAATAPGCICGCLP